MKMRILTMMIIAVALCACNKAQEKNNPNEIPLIFTATIESTPGSKATLDGMTPSWEVGDQIRINNNFIYAAQNAGTSAKFGAIGTETTGTYYTALFPASYLVWQGHNPTMFLLPDEECTWVEGKFNMPMYAISDDTNLNFKNICGVLAITVKDHQMSQVKRIRIYNPNKLMFGPFNVNSDGAMVLTDPVDPKIDVGLRRRSLIYTEPVPVYEESKVFYFPLAPQAYGTLKIEISEDGETFPYQLSTHPRANVVIERNKIYNVTFTDPRTTEYITVMPAELGNGDFE